MIKEMIDIILLITKLVILTIFSYKFATNDMNEVKTIYYGIWVLMCLV